MDAVAAICGSARTSAHNRLLLEGARAALTAATDFHDGWYREPPTKGLRAFSRVYGSLVLCAEFYRQHERLREFMGRRPLNPVSPMVAQLGRRGCRELRS